jgi:putative hydrolase of the HAD superfamily
MDSGVTDLRVISYDFWATLALSNPGYRRRRVELMAAAFGGASPATIEATSSAADDELDKGTLRHGHQYGFRDRVLRTAALAGVPFAGDETTLRDLETSMSEAFRREPPSLTESTLPQTLAALRRAGRRIAIVSNTGFVSGQLVREALGHLGLAELVDHTIFSDEVGHAKPGREIFQKLAALSGTTEAEILHIGDHPVADYSGARAAGMCALLYHPRRAPGTGVLRCHSDLLDVIG